MTQIKKLLDKQGNEVFIRTSTKAVVDGNGYTVESRLQAMQDEINQAQLEVGAVSSDLTPTEGSTNWVTSGGVYAKLAGINNLLNGIKIVLEDGLFFVDENDNIGAYIDQSGIHAINLLESEIVEDGQSDSN